MLKLKLKKHGALILAVLAVALASVLRQLGFMADGIFIPIWGYLRAAVYVVLFAAWGVSVRKRTVHPQVRAYLTAVSVLMVFWITVRTIRYLLAQDPWLLRHLWYLYYLPMLFIPLLAVFISISLGKPETYRLPKWTKLLYIPTALLFLLVLTNDLHRLVFVFPADATVWGDDYSYGIGYYFALVWIILCAVTAIITMICKCRIPRSRKFFALPFIPCLLTLVYGALYSLRISWVRTLAGDVTVVYCLMFAAVLESCIACGLIPSNTGYEKLFSVSRLGAQITDSKNAVCLSSANAVELTESQRQSAVSHPIFADNNTIIKSHPIRCGNVLWQEDITELADAIEQIKENCRDLAERNRIRQKNLETKKKLLSLQEKNRASDLLHIKTAAQIDLIDRLLTRYDAETDGEKREQLLAGAAVVGAYIKRYGNLLLVSERTESADIRDLSRCFEESFINLELLSVNCHHTLPSNLSLRTKDMLHVYRKFEQIVEACLYDLQCVWISAREKGDTVLLAAEFVCDTDLSPLASDKNRFSFEDGAYRFTFELQKGGESA